MEPPEETPGLDDRGGWSVISSVNHPCDSAALARLRNEALGHFCALECRLTSAHRLSGGSDGDRFRGCILPPGAVVFASIPARRRAGPSRRDAYQQPRERRLSAEQEPNSGGWLPDGPCAPSLPSLA